MGAVKKKKKPMVAIKVARCLGCNSCRIACAVEHSAVKDVGALARSGEKPGYRIHIEVCEDKAVPLHCSHCEEAACLMVCPTGAIHRDEKGSPVLVDEARCIGCAMCVQACPFGVVSLRKNGKGVLKCDLCAERLAEGRDPACVSACPTGALELVEEEEANRSKRRKAAARLASAEET